MALPLIVTAAAAVVYVLSSGPALGYYSARPVLWGTWHCAAVVNAYQPIEWAARQSAPVAHAVTSYRVYWHRFFLSTQAAVLPPSVPAVAARGAPQSGP
ncbi:hypothetical protein DB346_05655 [Verrucomicrobia bacterium LW23]|nr:hypothetical protein DB346_05655 [Verrucomicrobia bacterium LW23]